MAANEPDNQNNCSMCPAFTRTTAFSLSCHWSTDLSVICWSRFSQQVRTLSLRSSKLEIGMQYMLCCRAPHTVWSTGFKPGVLGGHTDGLMKFGTVHCSNSTVDFVQCDGTPSCWNTKWSPDFNGIWGKILLYMQAPHAKTLLWSCTPINSFTLSALKELFVVCVKYCFNQSHDISSSSDEFLGEDIVAAEFLCSSLHLPWFLCQ